MLAFRALQTRLLTYAAIAGVLYVTLVRQTLTRQQRAILVVSLLIISAVMVFALDCFLSGRCQTFGWILLLSALSSVYALSTYPSVELARIEASAKNN